MDRPSLLRITVFLTSLQLKLNKHHNKSSCQEASTISNTIQQVGTSIDYRQQLQQFIKDGINRQEQ